jgi:hypothetical protein
LRILFAQETGPPSETATGRIRKTKASAASGRSSGNQMAAEPDEPVSPSLESARAVRTALGVATGIIALVLGGLAWNVITSVRNLDAANDRHMRLDQLRGTIVHLDEVLTMSAQMAAATGDPRWETRTASSSRG